MLLVQLKRFKYVQDKFGNYHKEKLDTMVKFDKRLRLRKLFSEVRSTMTPSEDAKTNQEVSDLDEERYTI